MFTLSSRKHTKYLPFLILLTLTFIPHITSQEITSSSTLTIAKADITTEPLPHTHLPTQQPQDIFIQPNPTYLFPYPPPAPTATTTQTQLVYLPIPPSAQAQGPSPFLHPLAIILILCSILGFLSTLLNLPFSTDMSSSSSSARPSSSSASKPSSSSSSSRPSSSSSGSGSGSSSSSSSAKPPSPQAVPNISANAWMSFFLFCCLVLIILQGPLGLTGGTSILPSFPGWNAGWGGMYGGMPGCGGMVSTYVPWCQPQPPVVQPQPQPQIQVQQVLQNPPAGSYGVPGVGAHQMGGQGGFASPNGGGGWGWYSDAAGVRQQPAYYSPQQQRTVQYQRPGLQIQVNNARGGGGVPQAVAPQSYYPHYSYNTCPSSSYQYPYAPGYTPPYAYGYGHAYGYASAKRCTPWQPWNCNYLPNVFAYAHEIPMNIGGNGGVNIQSQHIGIPQPQPQAVPAIPVTPPPQPLLPPPSAIASLSNLENAFYPLLVGAIALLVVFDYAS